MAVTPSVCKSEYGLHPYQVTDYKGIFGDTSDNIKGIKGIGEKGALKLLEEFNTLEGIYENIEPGPRNALMEVLTMIKKVHVKTGDTVVVLNGKERGKRGKILAVSPKEGKVIIEGVNKVSKHVKPRRMGEAGGIVKAEAAMYACKVQIVCPHCDKPTRVAHKINEDGTKSRICKKCSKSL